MEIEILSHSHFPAADVKRIGEVDTLVIFRVDNKRNDSLVLTGKIDNLKQIVDIVGRELKSRPKIIGHKFTVAD